MDDDLRVAATAAYKILRKLELLSDRKGTAIRVEGVLVNGTSTVGLRARPTQPAPVHGGRHEESRLPSGVDQERDLTKLGGDHAPSKQLSLFHHYLWHVKRAIAQENAHELNIIVGDATRDYLEHTGQQSVLQFESHGDAVIHLLSHFTGVPAFQAAIRMRAPKQSFRDSLKWVQRQRVQNGRDAELGEIRKSDERTAKIFRLADHGFKQQAIADEVNLSRQRVQQILAGH